ncbi:hypothetical protein VP01_164g3 [Puccinia sorghi]|uniref:Uncharacterized protein n=1 Tax=Puccinia sorghi TaxID=27349 RepID=A0A0L6VH50_9BASI|nr:hypothetical protein VP01_164g3 [Puccinia sorghi]
MTLFLPTLGKIYILSSYHCKIYLSSDQSISNIFRTLLLSFDVSYTSNPDLLNSCTFSFFPFFLISYLRNIEDHKLTSSNPFLKLELFIFKSSLSYLSLILEPPLVRFLWPPFYDLEVMITFKILIKALLLSLHQFLNPTSTGSINLDNPNHRSLTKPKQLSQTMKICSAAWISTNLTVQFTTTHTRAWKANQISSASQSSFFPPQKTSHSRCHSLPSLSSNLPRPLCWVFAFLALFHHDLRLYIMLTSQTYSPQHNGQVFLIFVEGFIFFQHDIKTSVNQFTKDLYSPKIRINFLTTYNQHTKVDIACSSQAVIQTPPVCMYRYFRTVTVQYAQSLCSMHSHCAVCAVTVQYAQSLCNWLNHFWRKAGVKTLASWEFLHVDCRQLSKFVFQGSSVYDQGDLRFGAINILIIFYENKSNKKSKITFLSISRRIGGKKR